MTKQAIPMQDDVVSLGHGDCYVLQDGVWYYQVALDVPELIPLFTEDGPLHSLSSNKQNQMRAIEIRAYLEEV